MKTILIVLFCLLSRVMFAQDNRSQLGYTIYPPSGNDQPFGVSISSWTNDHDTLYIVQLYHLNQGWFEVDRFLTLADAQRCYRVELKKLVDLEETFRYLDTPEIYWRTLKWK